jgi:hypothetical protein
MSPDRLEKPVRGSRGWAAVALVSCIVLPLARAAAAEPGATGTPAPQTDPSAPAPGRGIRYFDVHRTLGTLALGSFASALVIGSASGNLSKLMDERQCCPSGGERLQPWRTVDRVLVNVGIVSYVGAASMALYNLLVRNPPSHDDPRVSHQAHRWLALAHGATFIASAATGVVMARSQERDPSRFAAAARIHVASNILLVPLLTAALSNITFE